MALAQKFEVLTLDGGRAMDDAKPTTCCSCSKCFRGRTYSLDISESKIEEDSNDEGKNHKGDTHQDSNFLYEGKGYCSLNCFFDAHIKKPCLCEYVDKLASMLFPELVSRNKLL